MGDGNQLMPESMQESNDHEKSMKNGCGNGDHANASTENQLKESKIAKLSILNIFQIK